MAMSITLGAGLGLLYGLASFLTWKWAERHRSTGRYLMIFLGGMIARLFAALALVVLVVALVPVHVGFFVGAFLAVFLVGLIAEVLQMHRAGSQP